MEELTGNYLIGFEGRCVRCMQQERAYYYYADKRRQDMMLAGTFMDEKANHPGCVTSKIFQTPNTMKWQRKLTPEEVKKDLKLLLYGMDIDFDAFESEAKENIKLDQQIDNDEKRMVEIEEWAAKKA